MDKVYQYANNRVIPLSEIKIPKSYFESAPSVDKLTYAREFYETYGFIDQPILLNNNGYLFDGYIRYLVAKERGLEKVPVIQIKAKIRTPKPLPVTIHLSLKERLFGKLVLNV